MAAKQKAMNTTDKITIHVNGKEIELSEIPAMYSNLYGVYGAEPKYDLMKLGDILIDKYNIYTITDIIKESEKQPPYLWTYKLENIYTKRENIMGVSAIERYLKILP